MASMAQISENGQREIEGSLKKFFRRLYKIMDLLKAYRAEKQKGYSAFEVFRSLLCLIFSRPEHVYADHDRTVQRGLWKEHGISFFEFR